MHKASIHMYLDRRGSRKYSKVGLKRCAYPARHPIHGNKVTLIVLLATRERVEVPFRRRQLRQV
jgi:hypothetical protein